ncbi:conserved hypothetical protein [Ferroglobus placidus DSM 10642]|uniref:Uncharacterized protein n=1 Tax=Ferroglobus placidus (strain DSM 10642 / AEDII12DO) TaxID=589924 RepID=D3S1T2_FERPA|nr:TIGR04140 family protein [Ferroglobus placidus]ADC64389.1 conserved hypothetical protein [Ferroglobus placidus DSM 10642]
MAVQIFVHLLGFSKDRVKEIFERILSELSSSVEVIGDAIICENPEVFVCLREKEPYFLIPRTEVVIICNEKVHRKIREKIMISAAGG